MILTGETNMLEESPDTMPLYQTKIRKPGLASYPGLPSERPVTDSESHGTTCEDSKRKRLRVPLRHKNISQADLAWADWDLNSEDGYLQKYSVTIVAQLM
jgi:hypothetical protein